MKTIKQQIEKKEKEIKVLKEKLENESLKSFRCKELNLEITPLKKWTKPYNEIVIPKGWRLLKTHEYFYLIEEGYENQLIGKFKNEYNYAWTQQTNYAKKYYKAKQTGATIKNLGLKALRQFQIPIPSLPEQERIVAILDKFDALVNDISVGLPAELNARRKQYEYYRDQLLPFKPLRKEDAK